MLKIYKVENNVNLFAVWISPKKIQSGPKKKRRQRSQEAGLVTNFIDVIKDQDT